MYNVVHVAIDLSPALVGHWSTRVNCGQMSFGMVVGLGHCHIVIDGC